MTVSEVLTEGLSVETVTRDSGDGDEGWRKTNAAGDEVKPSLDGVGVGEKLGEVGETLGGEENPDWWKGDCEGLDTLEGAAEGKVVRGTGRSVGVFSCVETKVLVVPGRPSGLWVLLLKEEPEGGRPEDPGWSDWVLLDSKTGKN